MARRLSERAAQQLRSLSRDELVLALEEWNRKAMRCLCGECERCRDVAFSKTQVEVRLMELIAQEAVRGLRN